MIKMKKMSAFFSMILAVSMCLVACNEKVESELPHMEVDILQGEDGAPYTRKNGSEQQNFQVKEGEEYTVEITVEKEEGKLNLYVAKEGEKQENIYEGKDIPSSQFTVYAEEAGDYIIGIEAYDFVGNYTCEISKVQ